MERPTPSHAPPRYCKTEWALFQAIRRNQAGGVFQGILSISGLGSPAVRFNGEATKRDSSRKKRPSSADKIAGRVANLTFSLDVVLRETHQLAQLFQIKSGVKMNTDWPGRQLYAFRRCSTTEKPQNISNNI